MNDQEAIWLLQDELSDLQQELKESQEEVQELESYINSNAFKKPFGDT